MISSGSTCRTGNDSDTTTSAQMIATVVRSPPRDLVDERGGTDGLGFPSCASG